MIEFTKAVFTGFDSSNVREARQEDIAQWLAAYIRNYGWSQVARNLQINPGSSDWYVLTKSCRLPKLTGTSAMNLIVPVDLSVVAPEVGHSKICRFVRRGEFLLGELEKEQHRYWNLLIPDGVLSLIPNELKRG